MIDNEEIQALEDELGRVDDKIEEIEREKRVESMNDRIERAEKLKDKILSSLNFSKNLEFENPKSGESGVVSAEEFVSLVDEMADENKVLAGYNALRELVGELLRLEPSWVSGFKDVVRVLLEIIQDNPYESAKELKKELMEKSRDLKSYKSVVEDPLVQAELKEAKSRFSDKVDVIAEVVDEEEDEDEDGDGGGEGESDEVESGKGGSPF